MPPKANLGDLRGLAGGLDAGGSVMIDGEAFDGAKAYKDSKVPLKANTLATPRGSFRSPHRSVVPNDVNFNVAILTLSD